MNKLTIYMLKDEVVGVNNSRVGETVMLNSPEKKIVELFNSNLSPILAIPIDDFKSYLKSLRVNDSKEITLVRL